MGTDLYMIDNGKRIPITLGRRLGEGGEAEVSLVTQLAKCAAKIYWRYDATQPDGPRKGASREKLEAMLRRTPPRVVHTVDGVSRPQLAWPSHLVEGPDGSIKGFLMSEASSIDLTSYMSRAKQMEKLSANDRSLPRRVLICSNLLAAVNEMHVMKHFMVDVKPENISMFPDTGMLCLLDNDSFSIDDGEKRHPATALTAGYIAPELLRNAQPPAAVITDWQDRFALAVLMFQVLNNGIHPFQGKPDASLDANEWNTDLCVREGWYPYSLNPLGKTMVTASPFSVHETWPLPLRELFDKAFTATQGSQRPSTTQWRKVLNSYLEGQGSFQACEEQPDDVTHIHFAGMPCPECFYSAAAAAADAQAAIRAKVKAELDAQRRLLAQRAREAVHSSPSTAGRLRVDSMPGQAHASSAGHEKGEHADPAPEKRVAPAAATAASVAPAAASAATVVASAAVPAAASMPSPQPPASRWKFALVGGVLALLVVVTMMSVAKREETVPASPAPVAEASAPTAEPLMAAAAAAAVAPPEPSLDRGQALARAMELAHAQNIDDALLIMAAAKKSDDAAEQAAQSLMRNTHFLRAFSGFRYERNQGRPVSEKAVKLWSTDRKAALELQLEAVGLAYEDRQLAADLAYYMALERHPEALRASMFALSLPRPSTSTATSMGWYALALALTSDGRAADAEGAMLTALAISPKQSRAGFCETMLRHEQAYGSELRPLVTLVFGVIEQRRGNTTLAANCASPPQWLAR